MVTTRFGKGIHCHGLWESFIYKCMLHPLQFSQPNSCKKIYIKKTIVRETNVYFHEPKFSE